MRLYSEFGAPRRAYSNHPCPACRGLGKTVSKNLDQSSSEGWFPYGLSILLVALAVMLW
ncbi:MAG: hypothetical protein KDA24_29715 [Deltaproteobacteria bacterium]|nr:hypothetical protein [Deltaproteobacteria bacterium]